MKRKYNLFLLLFFVLISLPLFAQESNISGNVYNSSNEPLIGVTVRVKGKNIGVVTNGRGQFSIKANRGDVLIFSEIGMTSVERKIKTNKPLRIAMSNNVDALDQVVVIGYGSVKKSHLTGAVSTLSNKELDGGVKTNVANALQGKIAGVSVSNSSGDPNKGMSISIRGASSLSNNSPLYVIDGAFGDINMVDPNDIQSIEVLKDAAAAAIYGSRAAGGVVLITTKAGKRDMPAKIDINFFSGVSQSVKNLDLMNGSQYSQFCKQYGLNGDGYGAGGKTFYGKGTDWQDATLRSAMTYKANVSVTGGSKTSSYSNSFSYLNSDGILPHTNNENYNIRLKNDYSFLNNRVHMGESLIAQFVKGMSTDNQSLVRGMIAMPPVIPIRNPDGSWGTSTDVTSKNPIASSSIYDITNSNTNLFLSAYMQVNIIDGLNYKLNIGVTRNNGKTRNHNTAYNLGNAGKDDYPSLAEESTTASELLAENTLNYDKTFGKNNLSLMVGYSAQKDRYTDLLGKNEDMPYDMSTMHNMSIDPKNLSATSSLNEVNQVSLFGRAMYSYDNRYLFSASVRRDGSSRFSRGHQYGVFPSLSLGWNIVNEKFAERMKSYFDELKIRLSYGKLGNQESVGYYPTQAIVSNELNYLQNRSIWYGSSTDISSVSPSDLTWENTETYNLGLDGTMFHGHFDFTLDAYIKNTNHILLPIPNPPSSGIAGNTTMNAGVVRNKGLELTLNYRNSINKFNYYVGLNLSHNTNKVTSIDVRDNLEISGYAANGNGGRGITMFKVGHPLGYFNLIESNGIFQNQAEIDSYRNKDGKLLQPDAKPGDMRYIDYNGDGKIDENDQHDMGDPTPYLNFGLRLGGSWNNFDINLFFDGMLGNKIYNYTRWLTESGLASNYGTDLLHSWTPEHPNNYIPRFPTKDDHSDANSWAYTDRWLEDGSYVRLKTLDIGYTLPASVLKKIRLTNLRIYTSIENLFTITHYKGFTPDLGESDGTDMDGGGGAYNYSVLSRGIDQGRYPLPRTISLGVQVGF